MWTRAHQECARIGEVARAARCAFWLAFALLNNGEVARGGGWVDRAQRLLDERRLDCVEQGYLRYAAALRSTVSGDIAGGHAGFHQAAGMGERFRDAELTALARIGEGRCLIYLGKVAEGVALLDEAMVAVGAREVSAIATGDAYCTAIEGCQELFDVRRAQEWTAALSRWCDAQPELVVYRGQCPDPPGGDHAAARRLVRCSGRGAARLRSSRRTVWSPRAGCHLLSERRAPPLAGPPDRRRAGLPHGQRVGTRPPARRGLTAREAEVLSLVAKGRTNRDIAAELVISEKTVASHLSHIFTKLGLSSRSAATAYAYEHDLAQGLGRSVPSAMNPNARGRNGKNRVRRAGGADRILAVDRQEFVPRGA